MNIDMDDDSITAAAEGADVMNIYVRFEGGPCVRSLDSVDADVRVDLDKDDRMVGVCLRGVISVEMDGTTIASDPTVDTAR